MTKGYVLLAEGFEEVEALTAVDLLRRAGISATTIGVTGKQVRGSHGITVISDAVFSEIATENEADFIVVPGGMPGAKNIAASSDATRLIQTVSKNGGLIAAICAAPSVVLYPLGLIDGKKATCYPGFEAKWKNVQFSEDSVCRDGNLITSRGAGTAIPFSISIIEYLTDQETAQSVSEKILA